MVANALPTEPPPQMENMILTRDILSYLLEFHAVSNYNDTLRMRGKNPVVDKACICSCVCYTSPGTPLRSILDALPPHSCQLPKLTELHIQKQSQVLGREFGIKERI